MTDVLEILKQNASGLIVGFLGLISAIVSLIKIHTLRKSVKLLNEVIKTSDNKYYVNCPNCGEKIVLKNTEIKE